MSRYYCPFCFSRHQFHTTRSDGVLLCGHCGDPLIKKPLINSRKFVGIIAASAFLAPLFIMIIFVTNEFTKERLPNNSELLSLVF